MRFALFLPWIAARWICAKAAMSGLLLIERLVASESNRALSSCAVSISLFGKIHLVVNLLGTVDEVRMPKERNIG